MWFCIACSCSQHPLPVRRLIVAALLGLALPAQAEPVSRPISWSVGDVAMRGHFVTDDASPTRGGLVMVPNWMGVNDAALEKAKSMAGRGYAVLLADVYGASLRPTSMETAAQASGSLASNPKLFRARVNAAVDQLKLQPEVRPYLNGKIGAVGFCFGGAAVLELARSGRDDISGVVSFHGSLGSNDPAQTGEVKASVLVLNGAADAYVKSEEIQTFEKEMTSAGADWQFVNFSDAVHCFAEVGANSPGCQYHERSAKRGFRMMDDFFMEVMN